MPTHEELPEFRQAFDKLDASDQDLFIDAVEKFIGAIKRRDEEFSGKRIEFPKAALSISSSGEPSTTRQNHRRWRGIYLHQPLAERKQHAPPPAIPATKTMLVQDLPQFEQSQY
jgi:hypothetical protein